MMAVGAACAFAANPFVDVPSDSWAYKSVVELADAGIIQGVDGSYFQGERNITRYEAAEMVAKAMAHMDKASVEQRALINKLADEYADELNNLGVRVSALENRVGNVKLSGDARIRFQHQSAGESNGQTGAGYKNDSSWDYRVRVRANAKVNDRTTVTYGISTDDINFADNGAASDNGNIFTDDAKVDYNFGGDHWNLSVGRTDTYVLGGENAYGFLRSEKGVHRLVRISPFDSNARRQTSFSSLDVSPIIDDDDNEIEIDMKDVRVDTYHASGAGGQNVNKTSSAVRMTHFPTGIVVSSQTSRDQVHNRENCMRMLRAKLVELREREREEKMADIKGEMKKIEWGSQIRSYVFHPYSLVKDHRTGYETSNVDAVMDGELDGFITAYLQMQ